MRESLCQLLVLFISFKNCGNINNELITAVVPGVNSWLMFLLALAILISNCLSQWELNSTVHGQSCWQYFHKLCVYGAAWWFVENIEIILHILKSSHDYGWCEMLTIIYWSSYVFINTMEKLVGDWGSPRFLCHLTNIVLLI